MAKVTFSIITPTLNSGSKLQDTIKSVLSQNEELFEYIIIDGGSADDTLSILGKYGDRIRWISEKDRGPYDAMNKGIKMAQGAYLYFLGAGDHLKGNVLEKVEAILPHEPLTFVYGNVFMVDSQREHLGEFDEEKIKLWNICHQAIFYERSIFEVMGLFSLKYHALADWAFNIRCFAEKRIQRVYVPLIIADFEGGGISSGRDVKFLRDFVPNFEELLEREFAQSQQYQRDLEKKIELHNDERLQARQHQKHLESEIEKHKQYQSTLENDIARLEGETTKNKQYQSTLENDIARLESEITTNKQYQSTLENDMAILRQDLEVATQNDKRTREELEVYAVELRKQTDRAGEIRAQISDLEELLSSQAVEIRELRAQSSAFQDQLDQSRQILAWERRRAQSKQELLDCMSNSPSRPLRAQLRPWNLWKQGWRVWQGMTGRDVLRGDLDQPVEDYSAELYLEISGWTYSTKAPIRHVGAFLDNVPLGLMKYGEQRSDLNSDSTPLAPTECGFSGRFSLNEFSIGRRTLLVRVIDELGNIKDLFRTIVIGERTKETLVRVPAINEGVSIDPNGRATLIASPDQVPVGRIVGLTEISWDTGDGSEGEVFVSVNGEPETLFATGPRGSKQAPWILAGQSYEFRLYSGTEHNCLVKETSARGMTVLSARRRYV